VAKAAGVETYQTCTDAMARAELRAAKRMGARMLSLGDALYPAPLTDIKDPPPVLWTLGDLSLLTRPIIAIVGTRNASSLGARMARHLATDLGKAGFVVVSGLARGIDALAHHATLETGTIAVQAGGLDILYPAENAGLARDIGKCGLRISEHPFGLEPQARHFPQRNRLVSGLAQAVVVVEAAAKSGSLITAKIALDQGRDVLAVPGHPMDSRASGCNILLRDGAVLVRNAQDVIEALQDGFVPQPPLPLGPPAAAPKPQPSPPPQPAMPQDTVEAAILVHLGVQPIAEDQLIRDIGHDARTVSQALVMLEMTQKIERSAGGMVRLVE
jgi:DNA processing protein